MRTWSGLCASRSEMAAAISLRLAAWRPKMPRSVPRMASITRDFASSATLELVLASICSRSPASAAIATAERRKERRDSDAHRPIAHVDPLVKEKHESFL